MFFFHPKFRSQLSEAKWEPSSIGEIYMGFSVAFFGEKSQFCGNPSPTENSQWFLFSVVARLNHLNIWLDLVGALEHEVDFPFHIWDVILPIDS